MLDRICDIIMTLITQMPWIAVMYSVHKVYKNKPKHTSINLADKLSIQSDR